MTSHFRFAHLTWSKVSGNTVQIKSRQAWRLGVGNACVYISGFGTKCGGSIVAQPTDLAGIKYDVWEYNFQHTFPAPGVYTLYLNSCCRIFGLVNASSSNFRVTTEVDLSQLGSTVSAITPILQWPQGPHSLTLPGADPDAGPISCRMATSSESRIPSIATTGSGTLSVSDSCVLSWDASTAAHASKYAAQVILAQGGRDTALDFIIEINSGIAGNNSPSCNLNGVVNNNVAVGMPFSISVTATDPDGDNLTVNHLGLPAGATLTPVSGTTQASPFTATFNWTPTSPGVEAVTITFTDPFNQTCQSSFSIDATNAAPTADAGADGSVNENAIFTLDGTGSSDPEGATLTYLWTQTAGPMVTLDDNTSATPSFTAPYVTSNQTVTFELVVNDGSLDSAPDSVDITIMQFNLEPIADAGPDMNIKEGATKFLDGTASFDPDGVPDPLTSFQWTQVGRSSCSAYGCQYSDSFICCSF